MFFSSTDNLVSFISPANVEYPKEVDWRSQGAVTDVKDQEDCGSCWAFAATGTLEGQHFRKSGKLESMSEQNLVDCTFKYGCYGCQGGLTDKALLYIKVNKGIDSEDSYPYEGEDERCRFKKSNVVATDTGVVAMHTEQALMEAVATVGPIAVYIDATDAFVYYKSGIFYDPSCSSDTLNHAVLAVGYGTDPKGGDYWLIKNSWSEQWGDKGYVKMARSKQNHCGIGTYGFYPTV